MTSKIVVNNIEADSGINTITFINEVTAPTFNGNIVGTAATFSGNVDIAGALTYEDVTNVDSIGIGTFRNGIDVTGGTSAFAGRVNVGASNLNNRALNAINASTTVGAVSANNHNASGILFQGYNSSVDANNASFVVQSNGSTGIGTAVPSQLLHLHSDSAHQILLKRGGQYPSECKFSNSGNLLTISNNKNGIHFDVGSSSLATAMYIEDGGNIGIGTDNPGQKLTVQGTTSLMATNSTNQWMAYTYTDNTFRLNYNGVGADELTITSAGLVGINCTPLAQLQVKAGTNANIAFTTMSSEAAIEVFNDAGNANVPFRLRASEHKFFIDGTQRARLSYSSSSAVFSLGDESNSAGHIRLEAKASENQIHGRSNHPIAFLINTSEKLRITSGGKMGLGTNSPGSYDGEADDFVVAGSDHTGITIASTGSGKRTNLYFADGTSGDTRYRGAFTYDHGNDYMEMRTAGAKRLRVTNHGRLDVFGSSSTDAMFISSGFSAGTSAQFIKGMHSASSIGSGTASILIHTNGNIQNTNGSYGSISDIKLKENIVNANSQWDDIKSIQIRNFNFKEETGNPTHTQIGVIAQEIELVSPGLVYDTPDTDADGNDLGTVTKAVSTSVLYMKAVKALQEAQTRIETLETRLTDALARIAALEGS